MPLALKASRSFAFILARSVPHCGIIMLTLYATAANPHRVHPQNTRQVLGAHTMPKELKNKKEDKKKPTMTPKEKKAAKRAKKEGKLAAFA